MLFSFLGPAGTFSEEAAQAYINKHCLQQKYHLVSAESIPEILTNVENNISQIGIVPIENSLEGSVAIALDMMVHQVNLNIIGEVVLPVRHHLLVRKGVSLDGINTVFSHPQALGQCRQNLNRILPGVKVQICNSTAEAAKMVASLDKNLAAIGTKRASIVYGLDILNEDIQDSPENSTRFVIVGKEEATPSGFDKTSIVFSFASSDKPGNLYKALAQFADRNINLTKLESRPAKKSLGNYLFFIDMFGSIRDKQVEDALKAIEAMSSFYKLLGSYPAAN